MEGGNVKLVICLFEIYMGGFFGFLIGRKGWKFNVNNIGKFVND